MKWMTKAMTLKLVLAVMAVFLPGMIQTSGAASEAGQNPGSKLAVIESIRLSGEGEGAELVINLSSPAAYTSYKTSAPLRLVVDLSQATQGAITEPIVINKGNFKTVTVNRYDTDAGALTRLDIGLAKDLEPVISVAPERKGELRISFPAATAPVAAPTETAQAATTTSDSVQAPFVAATEPPNTPVASAPPVAPPTPAAEIAAPAGADPEQPATAAAAPAAQSRALTAIYAKDNAIILEIKGGAGDFKSFRLDKPDRFVVDLFDVKSVLASRVLPVNAAGVAMARIGLYPDKVRVVFDALNGSFPEAVAARSAQGLTISLSAPSSRKTTTQRQAVARLEQAAEASLTPDTKKVEPQIATGPQALPGAVTPVEKLAEAAVEQPVMKPVAVSPAPISIIASPAKRPVEKQVIKPVEKTAARPAGPATVEMIDFQVIEGVSRVAVKVAGDVVVAGPVKTPGFVTLTIKNTGLPKRLQRSLDAKGFASPVLRVTPVLVKTRKGTDTRIKIALRAAAPYEFRQEGDMLFVDFKNPIGVKAEAIPAELQESRQQAASSAKALPSKDAEISAELDRSEPGSGARIYTGRKVTLEFADAEVRKIFQLLSEVSNKNFVLGDDVTGTISIKLINVPWDQALDIILDTKGLDKREDGNIIIIKGKGKFKSDIELEQENKKLLTRSIEMKTETFSVNYANISDIRSQFEKLKQHEKASITDDVRTNKVIVRDVPQAIEDMRKLKEQLDVPEQQVMIEARIVEATSIFTRTLGVNWGVHYKDGSASFLGINNLDTGFGGLASSPPTSGTGSVAGGAMGISFGTLTSNIQLDMRLSAAASAGLIKIVSTPKVATINNKTAIISQGQSIPYQDVNPVGAAGTAGIKFVQALLSLEVTPHINANGTIGMKINAKNDAPGTGNPPPINTKSATTELLLRDGETTVIGGIYVDSDTDQDDGVPFLMDIPLLGKMFKSNTKQKTKTELLIFITPRIIGAI